METKAFADSVADHTKLISDLDKEVKEGHRVIAENRVRIKCYEREITTLERENALRDEMLHVQQEYNDFLAMENARISKEKERWMEENLVLEDVMPMIDVLRKKREEELAATRFKYATIFEEMASNLSEINESMLSEDEGYEQWLEMKQHKKQLEDEVSVVIAKRIEAQQNLEVIKAKVPKIEDYDKVVANNDKLQKQYEALCAEWLELAQNQEKQKTTAKTCTENVVHGCDDHVNNQHFVAVDKSMEWQMDSQSQVDAELISPESNEQTIGGELLIPGNQSKNKVSFSLPEDNIIPSTSSGNVAKPGKDIKILDHVVFPCKRKSADEPANKPDDKFFKIDEDFKSFGFFDAKEPDCDDLQNVDNFAETFFSRDSSPKEGNGNGDTKGFFNFSFK